MVTRTTVLLGSLPGADAEEAMNTAYERTGGSVRWLPDGETGDRFRWIARQIDSFRDNPDLQIVKDGDMSSYDQQLHYKVRSGRRFDGSSLELGYLAAYRESRPVFDRLRAREDRPELAFQVGVASDMTYALLSMGPAGFRHRAAFARALTDEIARVHTEAKGDVVFLLELPVETLLGVQVSPVGTPLTAAWVARGLRRLVAATPPGTRFALHLCLGDLGHKAMNKPTSAAPLVTTANAICRAWPAGHPLEYLHLPLAAGDEPPTLDERFYGPLARLRLPVGTHFAAGFLHEGRTDDEQRTILRTIDALVGHPVDVAAACGLGRRDPADAHRTLDQGGLLTKS